ncbi:MAG: hypothetical protein SGARI_003593 [Bacillariaceae sp.]
MTFDITPYFPEHEADLNAIASDEFDMCFLGIDTKPIVDTETNTLEGSMVAVARVVTNFQDQTMACSEISTWTKRGIGQYDHRMVCRFPFYFGMVDFDPVQERLFASDEQTAQQQTAFNKRSVVVYPLTEWKGDDQDCFAPPIATLQCNFDISYLISDASGGTLLIGTDGGNVEVWDVSTLSEARYKRLSKINVAASLRKSIDSFVDDRVRALKKISTPSTSQPQTTSADDDSGLSPASSPVYTHAPLFSIFKQQPSLRVFKQPTSAIYVPKHLSANQAGFVTLQHHPDEGSNLLLWRPGDKNGSFDIVSRVNLSLHSRRKPCISFDGNRLIVFGEDHIGYIILVYAVSNGDTHFQEDSRSGEQSGGVYNYTNPPQIRFANRIRHAALGGISKLESIHMTTNERFIIVNTKTGDSLGGASTPFSEGLLVIDLQEQGRWERYSEIDWFI